MVAPPPPPRSDTGEASRRPLAWHAGVAPRSAFGPTRTDGARPDTRVSQVSPASAPINVCECQRGVPSSERTDQVSASVETWLRRPLAWGQTRANMSPHWGFGCCWMSPCNLRRFAHYSNAIHLIFAHCYLRTICRPFFFVHYLLTACPLLANLSWKIKFWNLIIACHNWNGLQEPQG